MKRKRGRPKVKPKVASPVCNVDEVIQSVVHDHACEEWGSADSEPLAQDRTSPLAESNVAVATVSSNLLKKARSKLTNSTRGFSSSSVEPNSNADLAQDKVIPQQEPILEPQDLERNDEELEAALVVIRAVMQMDAAEPFNAPVDPDALGIPDYLDVIETPMDFGTIRSNLQNGLKYKSSKDVHKDVQIIWDNCSKYNKKGHYILELMKRVKRKFMLLWTGVGLCIDREPQMNEADSRGHESHMDHTGNSSTRPLQKQAGQTQFQLQQHQSLMGNYEPRKPHLRSHHCCQGDEQSFATADHSHIPPLREFSLRHSPRDRGSLVDSLTDSPRYSQQKHMDVSQPHYNLHQPPVNYSQPYQSPKRSFQHISSSRLQPSSQSFVELDIDNEGNDGNGSSERDLYSSYHQQSDVRFSKGGTKSFGLMNNRIAHRQHDQPPPSHFQQHHSPEETCRGMLNSKMQPTSSSKQCADIDMGAGERFQSPPPLAIIRCNKCGPSNCPTGHMAGSISPQAERHLQSHQPPLNFDQVHRSGLQSSNQIHATSGKLLTVVESDSSDEFHSPPPVKSMIICAKIEPRSHTDATPNNISHQQQSLPSQMQSEKRPSEGLTSSGLAQPSQPQDPLHMLGAVPGMIKKKNGGRGPTRCLEVWNSEDKISVAMNELWQPIGPKAPKFICFLGTIARNGHIAPLNYINWKSMPDENKEKMWQLVESKFDIDPRSKGSTLKSICTKWKNWRAILKANHYNPHETDEERLANCNERVLPDQWRALISFWNSTEAKVQSNTNKANRLKYTSNHACGSKSFARVREEQRVKKPEGEEPSQADLYIVTRTRKDGRPVNEASSVIISQLRDAVQQQGTSQINTIEDNALVQVVEENTDGYIRSQGLSPTLSKLNNPKPPRPPEAIKMVLEAKTEVREMKDKMVVMEQTCAQMAAQMAAMMSMMKNKFSDNDPPNPDASRNSVRSEQSVSSHHGVPSLQKSTTRSGNKQSTSADQIP